MNDLLIFFLLIVIDNIIYIVMVKIKRKLKYKIYD